MKINNDIELLTSILQSEKVSIAFLGKTNTSKMELKEKYKEEVVVNEQSPVMKALLFLFSILSKIFNILFYLGIIVLCSIGATYIANKLGIINIF